MQKHSPSVIYFINEKYGAVVRQDGETCEVSQWDPKRRGFLIRLDKAMADFLIRVDRVGGRWCAAHPTYRLTTALKAAERLVPASRPGKEAMEFAWAQKRAAQLAELETKGSAAIIAENAPEWKAREARLAE